MIDRLFRRPPWGLDHLKPKLLHTSIDLEFSSLTGAWNLPESSQSYQDHTCCSSLLPSRKRQTSLLRSVSAHNARTLDYEVYGISWASTVWNFARSCLPHPLSACRQLHYCWASSERSSYCCIHAGAQGAGHLHRTWCVSSEPQTPLRAEQLWSKSWPSV